MDKMKDFAADEPGLPACFMTYDKAAQVGQDDISRDRIKKSCAYIYYGAIFFLCFVSHLIATFQLAATAYFLDALYSLRP